MPIDPNRVRAVFLSAVESHEPAARAAVLDRECSTDAALRERVEALLGALDHRSSLLDQPIIGPGDQSMATSAESSLDRTDLTGCIFPDEPDPAEELSSSQGVINDTEADRTVFVALPADRPTSPERHVPAIPGYEILGELGRGGMGVVYRARQVRLNRPCALKMILGGAHASPETATRFLAEAEAVARLQHPNIVQIHHIDEADGLPFFELEYVEGGSLDKRLSGIPWPARRAAELVEAVARGVTEAHRQSIIHRDLKPGNVLLAADGTPKITDFGLAKSLDVESGLTRTNSIMGSPGYMAPEQAEGHIKQVGPLADVYALGAILYELLTGGPPFRGTTALEILDQVKNAEPVPPSRVVPGLPHDVETIALKCLRKEPGKRYGSAAALAEDLRRFIAGETIVARPVPFWERAWRWCRRHPAPAALTTAVVLVAAVGLAGILWQWRNAVQAEGRAATERDRAVAAEAQARTEGEKAKRFAAESRAVLDFFEKQVLAAARPEGQDGGLGTDVTVRKAVDAAAAKIAGAFSEQPEVEASVRTVLGSTYRRLGEQKQAIPQLERAQQIRTETLGPNHPETLGIQGELILAYWGDGQLGRVIPLLEQTLAAQKAGLGPDHPDTIISQNDLAVAYMEDGRFDRAVPLLEQTLAAEKMTLGPDHIETLNTQSNLGAAYRDAGALDRAIPLLESTIVAEGRSAQIGPGHPNTLRGQLNLALCYQADGQPGRAIALFEQTLAARRTRLGLDHPDTLIAQNTLALAYDQAGDDARAEPLFREVLVLRRKKRGSRHPHVAVTLVDLGRYLIRKKRYAEAEPLVREGLAIWEVNRPDAWQRFDAESLYGGSLLGQGKYTEAEPLILSGCEGLRVRQAKIPAPSKDRLTEALHRIVQLYVAWGKPERAAEWKAKLEPPGEKALPAR